MEKDYFTDRPKESTDLNFLYRGDEAIICLKAAQKYAKRLDQLTRITITEHLTSQKVHPRGIKLKGYCFKRDGYGNLIADSNGSLFKDEVVGRCVYPIKNDFVLTKDGYKSIVSDGIDLYLLDTSGDFGYQQCVMNYEVNGHTVSTILNPYRYIRESNLQESLSELDVETSATDGKYIFIRKKNGQIIANPIYKDDYPEQYDTLVKATPTSYYGIIVRGMEYIPHE